MNHILHIPAYRGINRQKPRQMKYLILRKIRARVATYFMLNGINEKDNDMGVNLIDLVSSKALELNRELKDSFEFDFSNWLEDKSMLKAKI
jgi:hypothetical protein